MAGDPLNGGGFVILNGIGFDATTGRFVELRIRVPGVQYTSRWLGGAAIYVRDPSTSSS